MIVHCNPQASFACNSRSQRFARFCPPLLFCALLAPALLSPSPASAIITLKVQRVENDVIITGSGSANTTALTFDSNNNNYTNVLTYNQIYAGPAAFGDIPGEEGHVSLWNNITSGPPSFGSNLSVIENPNSGTGQLFGILAADGGASTLVLPLGYTSGASLSGTSTFTGSTLAKLGLIPGQISTWSWGSGATADSLRLEVIPDPVPAPLPIAGAAAVFCRLQRLRLRSRKLHA